MSRHVTRAAVEEICAAIGAHFPATQVIAPCPSHEMIVGKWWELIRFARLQAAVAVIDTLSHITARCNKRVHSPILNVKEDARPTWVTDKGMQKLSLSEVAF